jgi:hypothetical protein
VEKNIEKSGKRQCTSSREVHQEKTPLLNKEFFQLNDYDD